MNLNQATGVTSPAASVSSILRVRIADAERFVRNALFEVEGDVVLSHRHATVALKPLGPGWIDAEGDRVRSGDRPALVDSQRAVGFVDDERIDRSFDGGGRTVSPVTQPGNRQGESESNCEERAHGSGRAE